MTRANQTNVFAQPWTWWEKITFDQSFVSKHQILSFQNCILGQKTKSKDVGTFEKFRMWRAETFRDGSRAQTPCDMAVISYFPLNHKMAPTKK